ncbi:MAG: LTA synthase family protein [Saccharofermentanales bacterium]|jgi:lipoteichoic acid synthase
MREENDSKPEANEMYSGAYRRRHRRDGVDTGFDDRRDQSLYSSVRTDLNKSEPQRKQPNASARVPRVRSPHLRVSGDVQTETAPNEKMSGKRLLAPRKLDDLEQSSQRARTKRRESSDGTDQRTVSRFGLAEELLKNGRKPLRERFECMMKFALLFFAQHLLCEFIIRLTTSDNFFSIGILHSTLFAASNALFAAAIVSFFPRRGRAVVLPIMLIFLPFIYSAQLIYHRFFRTFFVFYSIGHGGQVAQFFVDIMLKILRNLPWIIVLFIPVIAYFVYFRKRYFATCMASVIRVRDSFICVALSVAMFGVSIGSMAFNRSYNSPWQNFFYENEILTGTNQFGLLTAMGVDISHLIYPRSAPLSPDLLPDPIVMTEPSEHPDPSIDPSESEPPVVVERLPQVLPVDFDERLGENKQEDGTPAVLQGRSRADMLRYLDTVFSRTVPTYTNEHTGRGKGFNLIFLTAESFSRHAIHPELTPTMWKMWHEGIHFKNFYNPVWTVSTLDGEYAGLCGMIPKQGVWTLTEAAKNDLAMAPGNLLRRLDYTTYAWHNHTWTYYKRDVSHPNLGYLYRGLGNGLVVKKTWPESDLEMMEKTIPEFIDKEPFHIYYLTVSGHGVYTRIGNMMSTRHYDVFKHLDLPEESICYMAANYDLELALDYLLQQLREAGIADRTLIVVNPDHYPYALEKANLYALAGKELDDTFGLYESAAFFYHDGIEPEVIEKYCSSLDLLPTIYNYMGLPYDSRMLSGRDILSDHEALVIFSGRSWISEYGKYDAKKGTFTMHEWQTMEEDESDYVDRINREVRIRFETAKLIVDSDYYRDLMPAEVWEQTMQPYRDWMKANPWPVSGAPQPAVTTSPTTDSGESEQTTAATP